MRLLSRALAVIIKQRQALEALEAEIILLHQKLAVAAVYEAAIPQLQRAVVAEQRNLLEALNVWRISVEQPEIDVREDLDAQIRTLADQIAVNEEQFA